MTDRVDVTLFLTETMKVRARIDGEQKALEEYQARIDTARSTYIEQAMPRYAEVWGNLQALLGNFEFEAPGDPVNSNETVYTCRIKFMDDDFQCRITGRVEDVERLKQLEAARLQYLEADRSKLRGFNVRKRARLLTELDDLRSAPDTYTVELSHDLEADIFPSLKIKFYAPDYETHPDAREFEAFLASTTKEVSQNDIDDSFEKASYKATMFRLQADDVIGFIGRGIQPLREPGFDN